MAKKKTINDEVREAMTEEQAIKEETVIIETEDETVYQSPQTEDASPFAGLLQEMAESGMLPEPEEIPQKEEIMPAETEHVLYSFPTPEQLDLTHLPDEELPGEDSVAEEEMEEDLFSVADLENVTSEEFFPDDMDAEEIAGWYEFLAEKGYPQFMQTPDGDEIEIVQETEKERQERESEFQTETREKKENREEKKSKINIYLNGKPVEEKVFLDHINEHKALYVAVLREQFPAVKKCIEKDIARQELLKKSFSRGLESDEKQMQRALGRIKRQTPTEKDIAVVSVLKQEHDQKQELQTPAEAAVRESDIQALIQRAIKENQDELVSAQNRMFERKGTISVEVNFTAPDGQVEHNAKLSRGKDGKIYLSLDGSRTSEHELRQVAAQYPGQLKAAVDFKLKMEDKHKESEVIR